MRRSLYLKDDDYRLSFLYGNFTTLTRFTELDAERILTERLGPLFVSIHTTDPELRARMLRNPKGATSLRWLRRAARRGHRGARPGRRLPGRQRRRRARGHPGRHPGPLPGAGQRGRRAARASAATPTSPTCGRTRPRRRRAVLDTVERVAEASSARRSGRRMVFAADEYYLLAGRDLPAGRHLRRATPSTRTGSAWRGPSPTRSRDPRRPAPGACATGSSPRSTPPRPRATAHRAARRPPRSGDRRPSRSSCSPAPTGPACWRPCWPPTRAPTCELRAGAERLLRRQHRGGRPAHRRGPGAGPGRRARRPALPAARRLPQRGSLPRRAARWPTCRGRSRWCRPTGARCASRSTARPSGPACAP